MKISKSVMSRKTKYPSRRSGIIWLKDCKLIKCISITIKGQVSHLGATRRSNLEEKALFMEDATQRSGELSQIATFISMLWGTDCFVKK